MGIQKEDVGRRGDVTDSDSNTGHGWLGKVLLAIVGDEPCVVIDWQGFADYAKR